MAFLIVAIFSIYCGKSESSAGPGFSAVNDKDSKQTILQIAAGSKDHTTLVAAVKAADYVDVLASTGPFTVFAPTNAAFEKLPPGTVDGLLASSKKNDLQNILEYHVFVGVLNASTMENGTYGMANRKDINVEIKNGKITINGANIVATIPAGNGVIHVIDAVLLPPAN